MHASTTNSNSGPAFQKCGSCGQAWDLWPDFVLDSGIRMIGFQAFPGLPEANLLLFEHRCGSSISILARRLRHILPASQETADLPNLFGAETCNQHCRFLEDLSACDRSCINARDRQLILLVAKMKSGEL